MTDDDETATEELFDTLKRQILELAIKSDNPQFKLDAYKATVERGKAQRPETLPVADGMTMFQRRVRNAEGGNGSE